MARRDGRWCCECDYCTASPCGGGGAHTVFLTDYGTAPHNYYSFCETHRPEADAAIQAYLDAHPGVERASEDE
jgi:hypothetical protein